MLKSQTFYFNPLKLVKLCIKALMNAPSKIGITVERRLDLFENQSSRAQYSAVLAFEKQPN